MTKVIRAVMELNGKILLLKKSASCKNVHKWCLPGGRHEHSETDFETLRREVFEETGYLARENDCDYISTPEFRNDEVHFVMPTYLIKLNSDFNVILNADEHCDYTWVDINKYDDLEMLEGLKEFLLSIKVLEIVE